jgi:hypothetical protein
MQKFSAMMLGHTSPRGAGRGKEIASQVQSPVQVQTTAQVQTSATDQNTEAQDKEAQDKEAQDKETQDSDAQDSEAHDKEAHTADVSSEQLAAMLDDYSIPTLVLNTDTTSESPSDDETTATEAQIHDMAISSSDLKISPEEPNTGVDSQPEHKPETIKEKPRSSPFVKSSMLSTYLTEAHWRTVLCFWTHLNMISGLRLMLLQVPSNPRHTCDSNKSPETRRT